jgi:hypothetical protein
LTGLDLSIADFSFNANWDRVLIRTADNLVKGFSFEELSSGESFIRPQGLLVMGNVAPQSPGDSFGTSLALDETGSLLAIGSPEMNSKQYGSSFGAVRLISFGGRAYSEGSIIGTIGHGYVGAGNYDVSSIAGADKFGSSVALNGKGDRLAVGAPGDDGAFNDATDSGAVYLFKVTDANFGGISQVRAIRKNDTIPPPEVGAGDLFGASVAFNSAGDRLVVGAPGDDGHLNAFSDSGAIHLFRFSDSSYGTINLVSGKFAKGYTSVSGLWFNVSSLEAGDMFGSSVSLSAFDDRLIVGASGDDGVSNATPGLNNVLTWDGVQWIPEVPLGERIFSKKTFKVLMLIGSILLVFNIFKFKCS